MSVKQENERVLSQEQIDTFLQYGVLVVDNLLSQSQLEAANEGLDQTLAAHGVDARNLKGTGHALQTLSSTHGSGGVLDVFYPEWKMQVASNPRLFQATSQLWEAAYCHDGETFKEVNDKYHYKWHPYGPFDCKEGFLYIDRIGYRIPTAIANQLGSTGNKKKCKPLQRSLTPHLDSCPTDFFPATACKWRPIQCFVSLTDNVEPNTGGFEAVFGFHRDFHKWKRPNSIIVKKTSGGKQTCVVVPAPCLGEYTHIRPKEDADVMERIQHVPVRAGSAVFWDNRIPHANAYRNDSDQARAVVYCSFLPNVPLNKEYAKQQLVKFQKGIPPTDQWINTHGVQEQSADAQEQHNETRYESNLTLLQRRLLGMDPW